MTASILVVEDEPAIQELVCVTLVRNGHEVRRAGNASEASAAIADSLPDLILLDWMLPDGSGPALTRRLRGEARTRELPIIMRLNVRSSVDLPQPEGPMKAVTSFSGISRLMRFNARKLP